MRWSLMKRLPLPRGVPKRGGVYLRVAWHRNLLSRRRRGQLLRRIAGVVFSLVYLTVAAVIASGTLAWCNSRIGSSVSTFQAVEGTEIFELRGTFDEERWLKGKGSGLYVTNLTDSDLWVYFTVSGSLRDLVQPVNPIQLTAGDKGEIPLVVDQHSDLALLAWRNQDMVFEGSITARAYNNFASHEYEGISISANRIYQQLVKESQRSAHVFMSEEEDATWDPTLDDITDINDLQRLMVQNSLRGQKVEQLQEETEHQQGLIATLEAKITDLLDEIKALIRENRWLDSLVDSLKGRLNSSSPSPGTDSGSGDMEPEPPPDEPPAVTKPDPQEPQEPQPSEPGEVPPDEGKTPADDPGENPPDDPAKDPTDDPGDGSGSQTGDETGDQSGNEPDEPPVNPEPEDPPGPDSPDGEDPSDDPANEDPPAETEPEPQESPSSPTEPSSEETRDEGEGNEFADTPDPAPALEATLLLRSRNPIWPAAGA